MASSGRGRWGGLDYPRSALMLGAWRALDKPFTPDVLLNAVSDALEENGRSCDGE
jgi:DNA-binding NtrC family response regulator